jgi:hypothetical protein
MAFPRSWLTSGLLPALTLLSAGYAPPTPAHAAQAAPAADDSPKAASTLGDFGKDVTDKTAEAAVDWARFLGGGCKGAADCFGTGDHADAELALGGAIETAVKTALDALGAKKTKVKLNDAVDALVTKVGEDGLTVNLNKVETLVVWADIDPKYLAILIAKGKPTDEPSLAAMATLRLLSGEPGDAKKQSTKLTGELGKKLGDLVDFAKALGPELKAARAFESALREKDPARAIEKIKAAWPDAKATKIGEQLKKRMHEQYVARGEKAYAGQKALDGLIHGKVTVNPAKASPAAGAGGVGLEIEYEFEKDSEGADFDCNSVPRFLQNTLRNISRGSGTPAPFKVTQSRLKPTGVNGGMLPIEFAGDLEIESIGGLSEDYSGQKDAGFFALGATSEEGNDQIFLINQHVLETSAGGKKGPGAEKKFDKKDMHAGMQVDAMVHLAGGKATLSLNGDAAAPVDFAMTKPLRVFALAAISPDWYVERLVLRGTATGASMAALARILADRQATALMGE